MREMSFDEFCESYNDNKYLYCETLDGRWWFRNMETGEDLPMYSQPIHRTTREEMMEEYKKFIKKGIIKEK